MSNVKQPHANHYGNANNYANNEAQYQNNGVNTEYNQEPVDNKTKYKKKFFQYFRKFLPLMVTRGLQFASSSICLGTTAYARHAYGSGHHTKKQNFSVAVSVISVFYIIALYVILMFARQYIMPGAFFLCEVILCLLWLCAFIVLAKQHGQYSCGNKSASDYDSANDSSYYGSNPNDDLYYNEYTGSYTNNSYSQPCKSSKASIAFAAFSFALFALTSVLFYQFVMKPILKNYGTWKDIFKRADQIHVPGNPDDVQLHRGSGLALTNEQGTEFSSYSGAAYAEEPTQQDLEAGNEEDYEHKYNTYSTQGSTAKSAGDESYYEKEQHQRQMQQAKTNAQSIPENEQAQYSGQHGTAAGAQNEGAYQTTGTGNNGYQSNTESHPTQNEYGGYYSSNDLNEQQQATAQQHTEEHPGLIQQAVDAGKKYINGA